MTRHLNRNRFAALALVLQVVAVFGTAPGVVLCVGPAGHLAVENTEAAARCRALQAELALESLGGVPAVGAPATCVDTPVFTAADRGASLVRFVLPALAAALHTALPRPTVTTWRAHPSAEPRAARARMLRSVVLLI